MLTYEEKSKIAVEVTEFIKKKQLGALHSYIGNLMTEESEYALEIVEVIERGDIWGVHQSKYLDEVVKMEEESPKSRETDLSVPTNSAQKFVFDRLFLGIEKSAGSMIGLSQILKDNAVVAIPSPIQDILALRNSAWAAADVQQQMFEKTIEESRIRRGKVPPLNELEEKELAMRHMQFKIEEKTFLIQKNPFTDQFRNLNKEEEKDG